MRRIVLAGGALLLVLLAALYAAPLFTDWTARREQLADIASARIGRPVTLHGPVRLRLLPYPVVEAEGVTLGDAGDGLAFAASSLRLRLDGGALLIGRIAPREMAVVGAELRLPWPPAEAAGLPGSLSALSVRLVDSRLVIGGVRLEGVQAELTAGDPTQGMRAGGRFAWSGLEWRFEAGVGRPGYDGIVPVELNLAMGNASLQARGILTQDGTVEGTVEASGPDLALLVPGPPGPFRARGRLTVAADLIAADDLALDIGGSPARGALTLRLSPAPRLDAALLASRIDLDPWLAALRARPIALPLGLDLSAEAASFRGVPLRRLRAAVFREGVPENSRLTLSDVSAILPGGTQVELNGATAGDRLEAALRFSGTDLRGTIEALGLGTDWLAPGRLREGEGRARLVLEPGSAAVPELSATLDGIRISGAGVLRFGQRPALGLGLNFDTLDLEGWLRPGLDWPSASRFLGGIDANLRLAAERARWRGAVLERASLDAALENGRLTLRRLAGGVAGGDLALSGTALLGPSPRFSDAILEFAAPQARALAGLLPGGWPDGFPLANEAITLRATAGGAPEALAVQAGAEWGDARIEAGGTLDLPGRRGSGTLTLRHPGAPRLLGDALGQEASGPVREWIGQGSLSLIAAIAAGPQGIAAERFDLVLGALRAGGQLTLALDGPRPRLAGRLAAETIILPPLDWRGREPLPLAALRLLDAELSLSVAQLEAGGLPPLRELRGRLRLSAGKLALEEMEAAVAGGTWAGALALDASGDAPRLLLAGGIRGVAISGPVLGLPLDIVAGEAAGDARLEATGSSPAALLATLSGEAAVSVRRGALTGLDAAAAGRAAMAGDEPALRRALQEGRTEFESLALRAGLDAGRAALREGGAAGEGVALTLRGEVDLARSALDVSATQKPPDPVPEVGVRLTGPAGQPRRLLDLAAWLRWRAER
ncbi:AsmA family protein [Roseomonas sp. SSH11]|uniref:AsmA family protein n=1 Tax=Pararoseomonas baculiformis TaxID=2820812 RepID=A0ABS4AF21_9PROT|nr:AsmA family protein [Pararoseomonas baculiformis]MBP0445591.1 AsmA family protein [Pararoseomonas baculiformis]